MSQNPKTDEKPAEKTQMPQVKWDHSRMRTTYTNVCNVSSTREEVSVMFGTNQTVNVGEGDIVIELSDRMILNPYAAKRLSVVLDGVIKQYEATFGELPIETK